jgi:hypothetical protein
MRLCRAPLKPLRAFALLGVRAARPLESEFMARSVAAALRSPFVGFLAPGGMKKILMTRKVDRGCGSPLLNSHEIWEKEPAIHELERRLGQNRPDFEVFGRLSRDFRLNRLETSIF